MSARERILARVREALEDRAPTPHPGPFHGRRPHEPTPRVETFTSCFSRAGGEVVQVRDLAAAADWIRAFAHSFDGVTVGATVPPALRPDTPLAPSEAAALGVSMALGAVAETGSLLLSSADGRRAQLLPPTHVVLVDTEAIHDTLTSALARLRPVLPSALGLHSGPSKSADIGQILVRGVHGPGRVVALLIGS